MGWPNILTFQISYLIYPALVPLTFEFRSQEGIDDFGYLRWFLIGSEAEDIGIVVLSGAAGTEGVMTQGGSYSLNLVGGNAHANAGAAYQDTAIKTTASYCFSYLPGNIRVVY